MEETVLTPRELLQSIKRRLLWILLSAVLAGILAVFLGRICWPPQYTALFSRRRNCRSGDGFRCPVRVPEAGPHMPGAFEKRSGIGAGDKPDGAGLYTGGLAAYAVRRMSGGDGGAFHFRHP